MEAKKLFDKLDEDHSGILDEEEVQNLTKSLGMIMGEEELEAAMKEMDEDGSGAVDFDEFFAWWKLRKDEKDWFLQQQSADRAEENELEAYQDRMKALRAQAFELFGAYDRDASGFLDQHEIKALALALGTPLQGRELEKAIPRMKKAAHQKKLATLKAELKEIEVSEVNELQERAVEAGVDRHRLWTA
eukprot:COSAG05_NODE_7909_length_757_cov_1.243161_1_plen_188_part_01